MFWTRKLSSNRRVRTRPKLYRLSRSGLDWIRLLLLIVGLGGGIYGAYHWIVFSDFFRLRQINVIAPTPHLTEEAIIRLSGLEMGSNLLGLRLHKVESNLKRISWVKNVRVKRNLPSGIILQVEEHHPFAILKMDESYLINREGEIFRKMRKEEQIDLPLITGFDKEALDRFPGYYRMKLKEAHSFLTALTASEEIRMRGISRLDYDLARGFTVFTREPETEIFFGKEEFEGRREELARMSRLMSESGIVYRRIDLHVAGKVFARM